MLARLAMPRFDDYVEIGRRITQAREEAGLTQEELGRLIGVSDAAVNRWEKAINRIDLSALRRIAEILGKPPMWFLGYEIDPQQAFYWRYRQLADENKVKADEYVEMLLEQQLKKTQKAG